jgi:hypothetical protein
VEVFWKATVIDDRNGDHDANPALGPGLEAAFSSMTAGMKEEKRFYYTSTVFAHDAFFSCKVPGLSNGFRDADSSCIDRTNATYI